MVTLALAFALRVRRLDTTGMWGDQSFTLNTAMSLRDLPGRVAREPCLNVAEG